MTSSPRELQEVSSKVYPSLERKPGKQNWVDKTGGLPSYIERVAKHLHYESGKPIGTSIAIAVSQVKKWCASSKKASTKAKACAAVAQWEKKKAMSKAKTAAKNATESRDMTDEELASLGAAIEKRLLIAEGMLPALKEPKTVGKNELVEAAQILLEADLDESVSLGRIGGKAAVPREMKSTANLLEREIEELTETLVDMGLREADTKVETSDGQREMQARRRSKKKPMADGNPKGVVALGDVGPQVAGLQSTLGVKATGRFDDKTEESVKKHQEDNELEVDGKVGSQTAANLQGRSAKPGDLSKNDKKWLRKKGRELGEASQLGDSGDHVRELQEQLIAEGVYVGDSGANGRFTTDTETAVRIMQRRKGLTASGVADYELLAELTEARDSRAPGWEDLQESKLGRLRSIAPGRSLGNRGRIPSEIKRLPDGTFAPKGMGRVLHAGDEVSLGGQRGKVEPGGKKIKLANGSTLELAPSAQAKPEVSKIPDSEILKQAPPEDLDPDMEAGVPPLKLKKGEGLRSPGDAGDGMGSPGKERDRDIDAAAAGDSEAMQRAEIKKEREIAKNAPRGSSKAIASNKKADNLQKQLDRGMASPDFTPDEQAALDKAKGDAAFGGAVERVLSGEDKPMDMPDALWAVQQATDADTYSSIQKKFADLGNAKAAADTGIDTGGLSGKGIGGGMWSPDAEKIRGMSKDASPQALQSAAATNNHSPETASIIEDAMTPLPESVTAYRMNTQRESNGPYVSMPSFTLNPDVATKMYGWGEGGHRGPLEKVTIPKGQKALFVADGGHFANEEELVLPRDWKPETSKKDKIKDAVKTWAGMGSPGETPLGGDEGKELMKDWHKREAALGALGDDDLKRVADSHENEAMKAHASAKLETRGSAAKTLVGDARYDELRKLTTELMSQYGGNEDARLMKFLQDGPKGGSRPDQSERLGLNSFISRLTQARDATKDDKELERYGEAVAAATKLRDDLTPKVGSKGQKFLDGDLKLDELNRYEKLNLGRELLDGVDDFFSGLPLKEQNRFRERNAELREKAREVFIDAHDGPEGPIKSDAEALQRIGNQSYKMVPDFDDPDQGGVENETEDGRPTLDKYEPGYHEPDDIGWEPGVQAHEVSDNIRNLITERWGGNPPASAAALRELVTPYADDYDTDISDVEAIEYADKVHDAYAKMKREVEGMNGPDGDLKGMASPGEEGFIDEGGMLAQLDDPDLAVGEGVELLRSGRTDAIVQFGNDRFQVSVSGLTNPETALEDIVGRLQSGKSSGSYSLGKDGIAADFDGQQGLVNIRQLKPEETGAIPASHKMRSVSTITTTDEFGNTFVRGLTPADMEAMVNGKLDGRNINMPLNTGMQSPAARQQRQNAARVSMGETVTLDHGTTISKPQAGPPEISHGNRNGTVVNETLNPAEHGIVTAQVADALDSLAGADPTMEGESEILFDAFLNGRDSGMMSYMTGIAPEKLKGGMASPTPQNPIDLPDGYADNTGELEMEHLPTGTMFATAGGWTYVLHKVLGDDGKWVVAKPVNAAGEIITNDPHPDAGTKKSHGPTRRILFHRMPPRSIGPMHPDYVEDVDVTAEGAPPVAALQAAGAELTTAKHASFNPGLDAFEAGSPVRSPNGNVRNVKAMGSEKFLDVYDQMQNFGDIDPQGLEKVNQEYGRRAALDPSDPKHIDQPGSLSVDKTPDKPAEPSVKKAVAAAAAGEPVDSPFAAESSPVRSPKGKIRNVGAMNDSKILATAIDMVKTPGSGLDGPDPSGPTWAEIDPDGWAKLQQVAEERGLNIPSLPETAKAPDTPVANAVKKAAAPTPSEQAAEKGDSLYEKLAASVASLDSDPEKVADEVDLGMFTAQKNAALKDTLDNMTDDGAVPWDYVLGELNDSDIGEEASDTAVRDAVFDYLGRKGLISDIKDHATSANAYPDPKPQANWTLDEPIENSERAPDINDEPWAQQGDVVPNSNGDLAPEPDWGPDVTNPGYGGDIDPAESPVRSSKGNIRNVKQMTDEKLNGVVFDMLQEPEDGVNWAQIDTDGWAKIKTELENRGMPIPQGGSAAPEAASVEPGFEKFKAITDELDGWNPEQVQQALQDLADKGLTIDTDAEDASTVAAIIKATGATPSPVGSGMNSPVGNAPGTPADALEPDEIESLASAADELGLNMGSDLRDGKVPNPYRIANLIRATDDPNVKAAGEKLENYALGDELESVPSPGLTQVLNSPPKPPKVVEPPKPKKSGPFAQWKAIAGMASPGLEQSDPVPDGWAQQLKDVGDYTDEEISDKDAGEAFEALQTLDIFPDDMTFEEVLKALNAPEWNPDNMTRSELLAALGYNGDDTSLTDAELADRLAAKRKGGS